MQNFSSVLLFILDLNNITETGLLLVLPQASSNFPRNSVINANFKMTDPTGLNSRIHIQKASKHFLFANLIFKALVNPTHNFRKPDVHNIA